MPEAYEQQERESAKAFAAFSIYLSLGTKRSLETVRVKCGKSSRLIQRWSSRWSWLDRVRAYETSLAIVEREATEGLARSKALEWGKRQQTVREEEWEVHDECIKAGREALKRFYERGKGATLGDIARMLDLASKLGRLASGLATDKTEMSGQLEVKLDLEWEIALKKIYGQTDAVPTVEIEPNGIGDGGA